MYIRIRDARSFSWRATNKKFQSSKVQKVEYSYNLVEEPVTFFVRIIVDHVCRKNDHRRAEGTPAQEGGRARRHSGGVEETGEES